MTGNLFVLLAAYLLGSFPAAVIVARRKGAGDIRARGSGNPGATNVLRVSGRGPALVVLVVDVAKGALAAGWLPALADSFAWLPFAAGAAAIAGHLWPVWSGLRGGKGVATTAGVVMVLMPSVWIVLVVLFSSVLLSTRRVSAASLSAAIGLVPAIFLVAALTGQLPGSVEIGFGLVAGLLVVAAHRNNLARLIKGTEPRLWM